ncbi:PLP-dependent aminotransferase family protein [Enterobacter chuandaensis]|uniref:MocR-like transcription factor YczR n=1 Tax=Enterobacter chuandaensis TaxID=2497875 RepID=UPI00292F6DBA
MSSRRFGSQSLVRLLGHWQQTSSRTPLWRQLADALRLLILDGRLALHTRLPGERELAAALNVSRTTVSSALTHLREEGYLESRHGSGSRVILPHARAVPTLSAASAALDLSTAALNAGPEIHQAYTHALTAITQHLSLTGYDQLGLPALREAIAARYTARGLPTRADEVMVVNGAVSGFALVLRMMTGPGDRVVVDHPTYPLAIAAIQGAQCRPVGVSLPETGWDTDGFAATLAQTAPRLAYLMPDFHNPTGRCMDIATRQAIADIAAQTRTALVVDETMVDLWFDSPPPPPLASFNPQANVITLGSTGKSFWGGLRLGWIRASSRTIATLTQTRDTLDLGSPLLEQLATLWLIDNSERFLPARRKMLAERRDRCSDLLREHFPEWKFHEAEGGLSYWIELPGMMGTQLAARAEIIGINLGTGTRFGLSGAFDRFLRMPFSLEPAELEAALLRIKPLWIALNSNTPAVKRTLV